MVRGGLLRRAHHGRGIWRQHPRPGAARKDRIVRPSDGASDPLLCHRRRRLRGSAMSDSLFMPLTQRASGERELTGRLLGWHYGSFAPFGFDVTPYLKPENLLVICCESPVETQPEKKRHIMGLFNDGDLKPYPASAYASLPEPYRPEVPLGLWQSVQLEYVGSVAIDWLRLKPSFEAGDGRLEGEARPRNLDRRPMGGGGELPGPVPRRGPPKPRRAGPPGGGQGGAGGVR